MLISESYRDQQRQLHQGNEFYGVSSQKWAPHIWQMIDEEGYGSVLDYGCGKGKLAELLATRGKTIREYDPAIPGKDAAPEPAELVVCTDVLEHIEPPHINALVRDLRRVTQRRLFFDIHLGPAGKTLSDGRNAHLLQKAPEWWIAKLKTEFDIIGCEVKGVHLIGYAAPKGLYRKATKRRNPAPELLAQIDLWKQEINKYADAFSRVETLRLWESVDDEMADVQVVMNILEYMPDTGRAMQDIICNTRKAVIVALKFDAVRGEAWWKAFLSKRLRIANWQVFGEHLLCVGAPCVNAQGITAIGAVDTDKRWGQVVAAAKRFTRRIEPAPAHGRRAVVACYGPSLADSVEAIKEAAADPNVDVISVSGAHDFLLQHGITPRYHIECDPRAHKTNNIAAPHQGVQYLIASTCHESYFDKLEAGGADIRLWHVSTPEHATRLVDELGEHKDTVVSGGGSVGLRSLNLYYGMGYRQFDYHAMDCSFRVDDALQQRLDEALKIQDQDARKAATDAIDAEGGVRQWAGGHAGKRQDLCNVQCGDRVFYSSPILLTYATNFFEMVTKVTDIEVRLYGDGLLQAMVRHFAALPATDHIQTEQAA